MLLSLGCQHDGKVLGTRGMGRSTKDEPNMFGPYSSIRPGRGNLDDCSQAMGFAPGEFTYKDLIQSIPLPKGRFVAAQLVSSYLSMNLLMPRWTRQDLQVLPGAREKLARWTRTGWVMADDTTAVCLMLDNCLHRASQLAAARPVIQRAANVRKHGQQWEYLVHYTGYPEEWWQSQESLSDATDDVQQMMRAARERYVDTYGNVDIHGKSLIGLPPADAPRNKQRATTVLLISLMMKYRHLQYSGIVHLPDHGLIVRLPRTHNYENALNIACSNYCQHLTDGIVRE